MRIVTGKMRRILHLVVICLAMLAIITPINVPTPKTVSARTQQSAYLKTGAFVDMETTMYRIFPFYQAHSWLNSGRNGLDAQYSFLKPRFSNNLIVPAQEEGKTNVPFKGWITREGLAREGNLNLVLKIYDQSNDGTKLYEAIHEVEVTHGQYFAIIQVPSEVIAKSQTIWLEAEGVEDKLGAFEPRQSFVTRPPVGVVPNATQLLPFVRLCYTCGSFWFQQTGGIPVPGGNPTEYGSGCSEPLIQRTDYRPYLCSGLTPVG